MSLTVFPLFMPKSESLSLLFAYTLFFKEQLERFAHVTLNKQKGDHERFAQVAHDKRATGRDLLFLMSKLLFCSFAHKKRANRSKN